MDCDRCGNYIDEFATCPDCVGELEQRVWVAEEAAKRTPLELAAGELLKEVLTICRCAEADLYGLVSDYLDINIETSEEPQAKTIRELQQIIAKVTKAQDNPSPLPNPPAQDAHKSVE